MKQQQVTRIKGNEEMILMTNMSTKTFKTETNTEVLTGVF